MGAKEQFVQLPTAMFRGLALNPNVVNRDFNSAELCSNVHKDPDGRITTRLGTRNTHYRSFSGIHKALYPFQYTYTDPDTNVAIEELLAFEFQHDDATATPTARLCRIVKTPILISYTGTGVGTITIVPEAAANNKWRVTIASNGVTDTTYLTNAASNLDTDGTLEAFLGIVDALSTYSCNPSSIADSSNKSFLDVFGSAVSLTIANGATEVLYYYELEEIGAAEAELKFTDVSFIPPSAVNDNNVMYFAYGVPEYKYDGKDFYRSGLPQAGISLIADAASGSTFTSGDTYIYKTVFARKDFRGNIIEGEDSDDTLIVATHTMSATRNIDLTVFTASASNYPNFNFTSAKVNGTQAGVTTITVDSGHTLEVGDTAYFFDGVTSSYVEREVLAITSTTVQIDGANVNVADNIYISNNVRIQIWRTKNDGVDFYLVEEIANPSDVDSFIYTDNTPDTDLIEPYTPQLRKNSLPPDCHFVTMHQGLRLLAGGYTQPNTLVWNLPDAREGFATASNSISVNGGGLGNITGIGSINKERVAVFKPEGHVIVEGTLDNLAFRTIDKVGTGIGCSSHRSLAKIGESEALVGVNINGPFMSVGDELSHVIGSNLSVIFKNKLKKQSNGIQTPDADWEDYFTDTIKVNIPLWVQRAMGYNDTRELKYHLYIPAMAGNVGSEVEQSESLAPVHWSSRYFVFDYGAEIPFWTDYNFYNRLQRPDFEDGGRGVNAAGGFCSYENSVWFGSYFYRNLTQTDAALFRYNSLEEDEIVYHDGPYPTYLNINYVPFTRELGAASAFFKALFMNIYKFLSHYVTDPAYAEGFGTSFNIQVAGASNYRGYAETKSTKAAKVFKPDDARICLRTKCVTTKARAYQIQLSNEDAPLTDYQPPEIDQVELVYCIPYDRKTKEPK